MADSLQVTVAKELHYMFGFPATRNGQIWKSPAWKMVKAVTQAITKGLEEDGKVVIPGFGVFTKCHIPAHIGSVVHGKDNKAFTGYRPARNVVYFRASKPLMRFINEGVKDDGTENTG